MKVYGPTEFYGYRAYKEDKAIMAFVKNNFYIPNIEEQVIHFLFEKEVNIELDEEGFRFILYLFIEESILNNPFYGPEFDDKKQELEKMIGYERQSESN